MWVERAFCFCFSLNVVFYPMFIGIFILKANGCKSYATCECSLWVKIEGSFHIPLMNIATMNCLCKHFLCWCTDVSVGSDLGFCVSVCLTVDVGLSIRFVGYISEWLQGALCRSDAWAQIDCNKEPLWISCADWSCETRAAVRPKCKVGNAF